MSMSLRQQLLLVAVGGLLFFFNLGVPHLWDDDEAVHAEVAAEMVDRGDYIVPHFNGKLFPDKPALLFWTIVGGYKLFGMTEFAARCGSALFGIGTVLVTYRLGRILFSPAVGFWGALILASTLDFSLIARATTPDALLIFFTTLALYIFVRGMAIRRSTPTPENATAIFWPKGQLQWPPRWTTFALAYGAMGMGVMAKGPVGVALPTAVLGLFLFSLQKLPQMERAAAQQSDARRGWAGRWLRNLRRWIDPPLFFKTVWSMRPLTAVAMMVLVAGPWYLWVGLRSDGRWTEEFFGTHNFGRFLGPMENHRGFPFFYILAILIGFFPWSILIIPTLLQPIQKIRESHVWRQGYILSVGWIAVYVGFFSLAGTKLMNYVLPAYPPLALLAGALIHGLIQQPASVHRGWMRTAWISLGAVGIGFMVVAPLVIRRYLGDDPLLELVGLLGLAPLLTSGLGLYFCERMRPRPALAALAVMSIIFLVGIHGFAAVGVDRHRSSFVLGAAIRANTSAGESEIGAYGFYRPSYTFYSRHPIAEFHTLGQVRDLFSQHPRNAFLLTTDEQLPPISAVLPPDVSVLWRGPNFLKPGEVLLLGRAPESTPAVAAGDQGTSALPVQTVRMSKPD
jgi:4-amino-4-deoxy-L-arabinose transferase-like glycosyltransferase